MQRAGSAQAEVFPGMRSMRIAGYYCSTIAASCMACVHPSVLLCTYKGYGSAGHRNRGTEPRELSTTIGAFAADKHGRTV